MRMIERRFDLLPKSQKYFQGIFSARFRVIFSSFREDWRNLVDRWSERDAGLDTCDSREQLFQVRY